MPIPLIVIGAGAVVGRYAAKRAVTRAGSILLGVSANSLRNKGMTQTMNSNNQIHTEAYGYNTVPYDEDFLGKTEADLDFDGDVDARDQYHYQQMLNLGIPSGDGYMERTGTESPEELTFQEPGGSGRISMDEAAQHYPRSIDYLRHVQADTKYEVDMNGDGRYNKKDYEIQGQMESMGVDLDGIIGRDETGRPILRELKEPCRLENSTAKEHEGIDGL